MTDIEAIGRAVQPYGLALRGAFYPEPVDGVPALADSRPSATVVVLGNLGAAMWPFFSRSREFADSAPDPLDRWTRRILDGVARILGATAFYPFGGPPWLPFQRWAIKADAVGPSPLGVLIHPDYGLWHAYRGALAFAETLPLPATDPRPRPCDSCVGRPCLSACPVGAFQPTRYDATACRNHVVGPSGAACREGGCLARLACPIGREHAYPPAQMALHMAAFTAARRAG
jgi:hypothetical protein